jgi:uncharacterized protein
MRTFLAITVAVMGTATAMAQSVVNPTSPFFQTINVTGTGRTNVIPDRFTFSVGVQTVAETVDSAVNENNARVASVIAALKKAGATDKDIRTSSFSIYPQLDYGQNRLPRILGYQVSNNITVRRENVGDAGRLLQTAVNAGVNTSSGLQFEVSDPARGRDRAMKAAFDEARAKAALLAESAGRKLGAAVSITEGTQAAPPPYPRPMAMRAEAASVSEVPVEAGTQEVSYTVSVTFELR